MTSYQFKETEEFQEELAKFRLRLKEGNGMDGNPSGGTVGGDWPSEIRDLGLLESEAEISQMISDKAEDLIKESTAFRAGIGDASRLAGEEAEQYSPYGYLVQQFDEISRYHADLIDSQYGGQGPYGRGAEEGLVGLAGGPLMDILLGGNLLDIIDLLGMGGAVDPVDDPNDYTGGDDDSGVQSFGQVWSGAWRDTDIAIEEGEELTEEEIEELEEDDISAGDDPGVFLADLLNIVIRGTEQASGAPPREGFGGGPGPGLFTPVGGFDIARLDVWEFDE